MKKILWGLLLVIFILGVVYIGDTTEDKPFFADPAYTKLHPLSMLSPTGEIPESLNSLINLSEKQNVKIIRDRAIKVAVAMHDIENDWSKTVLDGLKQTYDFYNVEVLAITNGEFKAKKQIFDLKNLIKLKPDVIVTLPLDTEKMIEVYREVRKNGIKLVFLDSVPGGFVPEKDYISFVVGDSRQLGILSAQSLVDLLGGKGKVALLNWNNKMFTVEQRTIGAKTVFDKYRNINVVDELRFSEFYQIPDLITGLLKKHPDLTGLWTVWDTPAFEAIKSIRQMKSKTIVATVDMNKEVAESINNDSYLKTTAVDYPFLMGVAAGLVTVLDGQQVQVPRYVVIHAGVVTKDNLKTKWMEIYRKNLSWD